MELRRDCKCFVPMGPMDEERAAGIREIAQLMRIPVGEMALLVFDVGLATYHARLEVMVEELDDPETPDPSAADKRDPFFGELYR